MKKLMLLFLLQILTIFVTKAQVVSLDFGMASNYSPEFNFSPIIGAQYHLKNKDYVGLGTLYDLARSRETYFIRYGTDINKRFFINSGIGFVNDWKTPQANGLHKTYRTYIVGFDYIFKKINSEHPQNIYVGVDFTDEFLYIKAGVKLFHEKSSLR